MNILQINTADNRGGAAKIAYELKSGLEKEGHTTSMFVRHKYSDDDNVFFVQKPNKLLNFLSPIFKRNLEGTIRRKLPYYLANDVDIFSSSDKILKTEQFKKADIVHCHNLHSGYFSLKTLQKISEKKPVVWTFHDMWPITPHCAHSFGDVIKNGFYMCPNKDIYPPIAWHNEKNLMQKKAEIYDGSNFHIVVPSLWMKNKVTKSILGSKPITLIYNGVDTEIFKPYDKFEARKKFGLPLDKKLVLFVTKDTQTNPWKGGKFVDAVIEFYKNNPNVFFLNIGGSSVIKKDNIWHLPYVKDQSTLAQYYSSADFLLYPTLADSFSLVTAEAMACGLPILTFNTGALPELVKHKGNGYIAKYEDRDDLLNGAEKLINFNQKEVVSYSKLSRNLVLEKFCLKNMVKKYLELYFLLKNKKGF